MEGNKATDLHLSESQTTVSRTTLDRLTGQDLNRSSGSGVDLVVDHMFQTLA
jgi:hypothetical protein